MQAITHAKQINWPALINKFKEFTPREKILLVTYVAVIAFMAIAATYLLCKQLLTRIRKPTAEEMKIRDEFLKNEKEIKNTRFLTGKPGDEGILAPAQFGRELQGALSWALNGKKVYQEPSDANSAYRALIAALGGDPGKAAIVANVLQQGTWAYIWEEMKERFHESVGMVSQNIAMTITNEDVKIVHTMDFQRFTIANNGDKIPLGTRGVERSIEFSVSDISLNGKYPSLKVQHTYKTEINLPQKTKTE